MIKTAHALGQSNSSPPTAQEVESQVANDINACKQLIRLLNEEAEALKARKPEQLEQIINEKTACLVQLDQSANVRSQWMKVPTEQAPDKWQSLLDSFNSPGIKAAWNTLKRLLEECKVKNETNGKMLARNQQVFSKLVNIMRGQSSAPSLYTETGKSSGGYTGGSVGEA